MEKNMENEMKLGLRRGYAGIKLSYHNGYIYIYIYSYGLPHTLTATQKTLVSQGEIKPPLRPLAVCLSIEASL